MSNHNIIITNTINKIYLLPDKTTKEKPQKCVCCLTNIGPFVNLTNCSHTSFLEYVYKCYNFHTNLVCRFCHAQLKKIARFQQQVATSALILKEEAYNVKTNYPRLVQSALEVFSTKVQPSEALILSPPTEISDQCDELIIKAERDSSRESNQSEELIIKAERDSSRECSPEAEVSLAELKRIESNVRAPQFVRIAPAIEGIPCEWDGDIKAEKEVVIESTPDAVTTSASTNKKNEKNKIYSDKILTITLSAEEMQDERERDRARPVFFERTYKCTKCIIGFDHEPFFIEHNEKRHAEIPDGHTCQICDSVFATRIQYSRHYKLHFIRYQCVTCGLRLLSYFSMTQHISRNHEQIASTYKCKDCDYVAKSHRSFRYHRSKHKTRPICAQCGQSFVTHTGLRTHMSTIHNESPKISCDKCHKEFKSRSGMIWHRKHRHNDGNNDGVHYCKTCNLFYKSQLSYNAHLKTSSKHVTEDDKRFKCDQCEAKFLNKAQLQKHVEFVHIGVEPIKCDECDKLCKDKAMLKRHKRYVHEKRRPPRTKICDHCGKGFTTTAVLVTHIRTHTGERPLICRYCNATFAHKASLYTHTKLLHKRPKK